VVIRKCSEAEFRDASLPGYELGSKRIEFIGSCRIMAGKELGGAKNVSCVM
jgi:hypothetical protein